MEIMDTRIGGHFVQFSGLFAGRKPAAMLKDVFGIWTSLQAKKKRAGISRSGLPVCGLRQYRARRFVFFIHI
jgi:hypothetical protein